MSTDPSALSVREIDDARVAATLDALRTVYKNGGVVLLSLEYADPAAGSSHAAGGDAAVRRLLARICAQGVAPELQIPADGIDALPFEWRSSHEFESELFDCLVFDGASGTFPGGEDDARFLARDFVEAIFGADHRAEANTYASSQAWSPWFRDEGLDHTFAGEEIHTGRWWLLCTTDGA